MDIIKTISYNQIEIIKDIVSLHTGYIELDPTYSKGNFYKDGLIKEPHYKYDLFPQREGVIESDAAALPLQDSFIKCMMFDPPFIVGNTTGKPSGKIAQRFGAFRYIKDLWAWYDLCLIEFYRIIKPKGYLIFKCQDTVSSGKQYLSHIHIINEAEKLGFYTKDLFVLLAKNRIIGHNHKNQKHARKFHSYFLVFEKKVTIEQTN